MDVKSLWRAPLFNSLQATKLISEQSGGSGMVYPIGSLMDLIASGEGGYNSMNKGTDPRSGKILGSTSNASDYLEDDLTNLTIKQIMKLQKERELRAAGRYQIIPSTLEWVMSQPNAPDPNSKFDESVQDRLGTMLIQYKQPDAWAYLTGQSDDMSKALKAMASEWASLPDPDKSPETGRGVSYYSGDGTHSRARHSIKTVERAMNQAREDIMGATRVADGRLSKERLDKLSDFWGDSRNLDQNSNAKRKEIESEIFNLAISEGGQAASTKLKSYILSDDEEVSDIGSYIYKKFGSATDKHLNGVSARVASSVYDFGGPNKDFLTRVAQGFPFEYWLDDNGSKGEDRYVADWTQNRAVASHEAATRATSRAMNLSHGLMPTIDDEGRITGYERARQKSALERGIEAIGSSMGYFQDDPETKEDESQLGWNLAPGSAGIEGSWKKSLSRLKDSLPLIGVGKEELKQRQAYQQNLGDSIHSNITNHISAARPKDFGFGADEITSLAGFSNPFSQRAPNASRFDPSFEKIRYELSDETEEQRARGVDLLQKYKSMHFPDAKSVEEFNKLDTDETIETIESGKYQMQESTQSIDNVLLESLKLKRLPNAPILQTQSESKRNVKLNEGGIVPLSEGGVAGHMNHLYDNPNLTFKEMKGIFRAASNGELKGTEKTDGQNLQLSYDIQTSSARAARNKGNIRDGGMDAAGLAAKFGGRGALETAFTEAFSAFEEAIGRMSIEEREEIFGPNTNIYYNAEVQDPRAANLINYDLPTLTIHRVGHREYDRETGSATDRDVSKNAKKLAMALGRVQGERQEGLFHVQMNAIRQLEALSDDTAANLAIARLEKALSNAGISDSQTVGEYVISKVDAVVDSRISLPVETKMELMKRMFKEPGANIRNVLGMIPKEDAGTIAVVRELVAEASALMTAAVAPIEEIVHDFSVEMLKGLHSAFILDNESEVERLRQETQRAITAIEGSNSEEAMEILAKQMSKLKDVEGVSTAAEGFVFDYDDVTYKFTGNFAPMNQLLGLFKYGRGNVPPMQKLDEEEGEVQINRTVAIVPGGFKPPHKGHLAMVDHYSKLSDIVFVFISPLSRGSKSDEAEVSFNQSKKIWNLYINSEGLGNVKIIDRPATFNSPVQMAYEFSENKKDESYLAQPGDRILFGASEKADNKGNPDWMRFQNAQKYVRDGAIAGDPAEFASPVFFDGLSATDFRKALNNANVEEINQFLPQNVDSSEILSILGIGAEPESPIEEMSSMGGGAVEGGGSGQRERDSLIREEDGIIEEVLNYLLQKRNSHD